MTSPLQDLQNRINSNTLTPAQQGALSGALAVLIPVFPSVDEQGNAIPTTETQPLAAEWIAPLFALNANASGGSSVTPTTQIAWWVNPSTGSDSNSGTSSASPLKTLAALGALWRGSNGGGRPVLAPATGATITVTVQGNLPTSDPFAPVLDVDLANSARLIFVGGANTPAHTGTVATANAWARTSANGQVRITDSAVADFHALVGNASLVQDANVTTVAWLYGPDTGSSATGTLFVPYQAQTPGVASVPTTTAILAGDVLSYSQPLTGTLGQGFVTRSYPAENNGEASVFFYRFDFTLQNNNDTCIFDSLTAQYSFQECMFLHAAEVASGAVSFLNCFFWHNAGLVAADGGAVECLFGGGISGQAQGSVNVLAGGLALLDTDFAVFSERPVLASQFGLLELGDFGFWQNGGAGAIAVGGGVAGIALGFGAESIVYGNAGAGPIITVGGDASGGGQFTYRNDGGGTPAATQIQFNVSTFKLGEMASPFGVTLATAAYVGPTTPTLAHLDAALGAGTGFGGLAIDNSTGATMRVHA